MKVFVGLGNPGEQYRNTRHNAGQQFIDYWWKEHQFPAWQAKSKWHVEMSKKGNLVLLKPQTFMNESGKAVRAFLHFHIPNLLKTKEIVLDDVFIFHDDLDLEVGNWKLQFDSGPRVHNGLTSVRSELRTTAFWYGRIGVDAREGDRSQSGREYVLEKFRPDEKKSLVQVFAKMTERLNFELQR